MLWFVEQSGGESQFCSFSRNRLSVTTNQFQGSTAVRPGYERFSFSAVSADRFITAFVSFTSSDINVQERIDDQENVSRPPSTSTVTLSSTLCVTFRVSAIAIRASSVVSVSSRFSALSILFRPSSLFTIFSKKEVSQEQIIYCSSVYLLDRPCFISFVAMAKIESISIIIFTMTSVIAAVGGTSVYDSRRLKKLSIRTKISMSTSWLASISLAA
jgi:hypothetical protein